MSKLQQVSEMPHCTDRKVQIGTRECEIEGSHATTLVPVISSNAETSNTLLMTCQVHAGSCILTSFISELLTQALHLRRSCINLKHRLSVPWFHLAFSCQLRHFVNIFTK